MTSPPPTGTRIVVCEDGDEYVTRFARLLGQELQFQSATSFAQAKRLLDEGAAGMLLDLDFRRTDPGELVDESGACHPGLNANERRRLAQSQGILILRALRGLGLHAPAILFADFDDPMQTEYLTRTLAPLVVVPSSESLPSIAEHIRRLTARP
jgi:hypothetical protein